VTARLVGIDHVQLAIPAGPEAETSARRFYVDLLGLREVPKPAELAGRGGLWLVGPAIAIHLGVETPFVAARKAHPAVLVEGLPELVASLGAAGTEVAPDEALPRIRRAYVHDPFGNRIELIEAADGGFTEPAGQ
jgi:catechol 2,3-dioxygenase-like lactoylglutathione lyase family enzyme